MGNNRGNQTPTYYTRGLFKSSKGEKSEEIDDEWRFKHHSSSGRRNLRYAVLLKTKTVDLERGGHGVNTIRNLGIIQKHVRKYIGNLQIGSLNVHKMIKRVMPTLLQDQMMPTLLKLVLLPRNNLMHCKKMFGLISIPFLATPTTSYQPSSMLEHQGTLLSALLQKLGRQNLG